MTKDYTPKNTDFVWNGDESKHTEARKMLARKVREKFGTIGDWYTIKGLPTERDDDVEKVCLEILTMYRERRNSGYADILWDTDEFWTEEWLIRWFGEQKQKVYDILEPWVSSTALQLLEREGVEGVDKVFGCWAKEIGGGSTKQISKRTKQYVKGMIDDPTKETFDINIDLKAKLRQLEDEKAWLTSKCPKEQQATYELAKDTKLVGILNDVLHPTYKRCITKLMDTNKLLLMAKGEAVPNYDSYEPRDRQLGEPARQLAHEARHQRDCGSEGRGGDGVEVQARPHAQGQEEDRTCKCISG